MSCLAVPKREHQKKDTDLKNESLATVLLGRKGSTGKGMGNVDTCQINANKNGVYYARIMEKGTSGKHADTLWYVRAHCLLSLLFSLLAAR